ncbi:MAG: lyase family protein [Ilumatobacteraceae bacterium]
MTETLYPGFSTERMDEIFALGSRVSAMCSVEAAVASAQGGAGDIPVDAAAAIVAACGETVDAAVLADGWRVGTPVLGLLETLRSRLEPDFKNHLHHGLTTQDVIDTAMMLLVDRAIDHLADLGGDCAGSLRAIIRRSGSVGTQARSFLQPADITTVGFRTARWLLQLDHIRRRLAEANPPVQLGGLIGDRMEIATDVVDTVAAELGLAAALPWHTDRGPVIAVVELAVDLARWAGKVAVDVAQLVQFGEITTRAGGSSAAAGKRNPIDAMRAMAAAEACAGIATVITHAKPHELERGLGSWHAEWFALPLIFQTAAAATEAIGAALASLEVEPSAVVVGGNRRVAADAFVTSVLEQSP